MRQAANISSRLRRTALVIAVVATEVFGCTPAGATQGADPQQFRTAAEMYATVPVKAFDATAAALLKTVNTAIRGRLTIEDDRIWVSLIKLNPYRTEAQVQSAIFPWARTYADEIRGKAATGTSVSLLETANAAYKKGKFDEASLQYRKLLITALGHLDARNNLALAQMRLGNDLAAQLELSILRQLDDNYIPAAVNLTVIYERLGQRTVAQNLAEQTLKERRDIQAVVYNASWYKDLAGAHKEALQILGTLNDPGSTAAFKPYRELLEKEVGTGAHEGPRPIIGTVLLVIVLFILIMLIRAAASAGKHKVGFGNTHHAPAVTPHHSGYKIRNTRK